MLKPENCPFCAKRGSKFSLIGDHRIESTTDEEGRARWICRSCDLYIDGIRGTDRDDLRHA